MLTPLVSYDGLCYRHPDYQWPGLSHRRVTLSLSHLLRQACRPSFCFCGRRASRAAFPSRRWLSLLRWQWHRFHHRTAAGCIQFIFLPTLKARFTTAGIQFVLLPRGIKRWPQFTLRFRSAPLGPSSDSPLIHPHFWVPSWLWAFHHHTCPSPPGYAHRENSGSWRWTVIAMPDKLQRSLPVHSRDPVVMTSQFSSMVHNTWLK